MIFITNKTLVIFPHFYRTAWNAARYSDEKAVCLSVCLAVCPSKAWILRKRKKVLSKFLHHTKDYFA